MSLEGRRLRFPRSVISKRDGRALFLVSDAILRIESDDEALLTHLPRLEQGVGYEELVAAVSDRAALDRVLRDMLQAGFLVEDRPNLHAGTRLEKQVEYAECFGLDGNAVVERLRRAQVVLLGVGGTGVVLLQHLVAAGVGRYLLIDPDRVQLANLNRQFIYHPDQVGQPKVEAARDYVLRNDPDAQIRTWPERVDAVEDLERLIGEERPDFFVLAADQPPNVIDRISFEFCQRRALPFLGGGCGFTTGSWGPLVSFQGEVSAPGATDPSRLPAGLRGFGGAGRVAAVSFGPTNTIIGAFMARDVLHYLMGIPSIGATTPVTLGFRSLSFSRPAVRDRSGS